MLPGSIGPFAFLLSLSTPFVAAGLGGCAVLGDRPAAWDARWPAAATAAVGVTVLGAVHSFTGPYNAFRGFPVTVGVALLGLPVVALLDGRDAGRTAVATVGVGLVTGVAAHALAEAMTVGPNSVTWGVVVLPVQLALFAVYGQLRAANAPTSGTTRTDPSADGRVGEGREYAVLWTVFLPFVALSAFLASRVAGGAWPLVAVAMTVAYGLTVAVLGTAAYALGRSTVDGSADA